MNSEDTRLLLDQGGREGGSGGWEMVPAQLISLPYLGEDATQSCLMS